MSHIIIDARQYSTSTGRYISRLLQHLEQLDKQTRYTVLLKPEDLKKYQPTADNFTTLACPYKEYTFAEQLGLLRQLRGLKPDLVHFGMTQQPVLYHRPKVTTVHDLTTARFTNPDKQPLIYWAKQQVYKAVIKSAARHSKAVITPTQYVKDDLVAYARIPADKVIVTLEAADALPDTPEPVVGLEKEQFIMYVGRPTPHKNLERLVGAFQQLKGQHPDLKLVLAGKLDNNYRAIKQKTDSEQIANIIYTDYVTDGQLRWLYEHCAAYVFPSLSEGFGLPGLEAMQHGAPVVSSNATCLPEVYGDAAHYFDPSNVENMADAINEVLTDKALRSQLIAAGHAQASQYSWRRMAEETLAVYQKVLGG